MNDKRLRRSKLGDRPAAGDRRTDGPPRRRGVTWLVRPAALGLLTYLAIILMLAFFENELVYPGWRRSDGDWSPAGLHYEDVFFHAEDGTRLHGWYLPHEDPTAYVLYCHGNGDIVADAAWALDDVRQSSGAAIFVFDYRGYGRSEGRPHEAGVVADADAALDWLCQKADVPPERVVLIGRSLGGAVAARLAAQRGARGLVLERTFTSLPEVAHRVFPWLPVRLLMRNRYETLPHVAQYRGPLLQSHGTADELVPIEAGRQVFEAAASRPKQFIAMPGCDHNGPDSAEYREALREFLVRGE